MSEVKGEMLTCDVCGEKVFCVLSETGTADGGWTHWDSFDKPHGWKTHYNGYKDVCPKCYSLIEQAIKNEVKSIQVM